MAIDLNILVHAYSAGIFPMSDARDDDEIYWVEPKMRAILPLDGFNLSRSLAKTIRQDRFNITCDTAFAQVIALCAEETAERDETWINQEIEEAFFELHHLGMAHSVECWSADGALVGGLYGLALGRAFFGESMFSRASDASKVALAALIARLRIGGFELLDCQFMTEHLGRLGAIEISQETYLEKLKTALRDEETTEDNQFSTVCSSVGCSSGWSDGAGSSTGATCWGALDCFLGATLPATGAAAASGSATGAAFSVGASSPGKAILHCLTHTS